MNIILVSPYVPPSARGDAFTAERLRQGLQARGHEVRLYNSRRPFVEEVLAAPADVLHSINAYLSHDWVERYLEERSIPWVITLTGTDHDTAEGPKKVPAIVTKSVASAHGLVVHHQRGMERLVETFGAARDKTRILRPGVEPLAEGRIVADVRRDCAIGADKVFFLMASGIRPVKDVGLALSAFKALHSKNIALGLVGPGIDPVETAQVLSLGVSLLNFYYFGPKMRNETRECMRAADVFVNTSRRDELSSAMLEAMAEGCAIIATATAANETLIVDGQNGLLVPPGDSDALATAASMLESDEYLRNRLAKSARDTIKKDFSLQSELEGYEALYGAVQRNLKGTPS